MAGLNSVHLIGNLGRDPEVRYTGSGTPVVNFSLAMNETWKDKGGKVMERVEWIGVIVWGKQAESCGKYLTKGREVSIIGRLQTRKWTDKANVDRYVTEIVASQVIFLGQKPEGSSRPPQPPADDFGPPPPRFEDESAPGSEDIPY